MTMHILPGIISWFLILCGLTGAFGLVIFIPWGILKIIKANKEIDKELKNKGIRNGVLILFMPIMLIAGSLILLTIVNVIAIFIK